jgi:hypothetical protein
MADHNPAADVPWEWVEWLWILIDEYKRLRAESGVPEDDTYAAAKMLSSCEMLADALDDVADPIVRTGPPRRGGNGSP